MVVTGGYQRRVSCGGERDASDALGEAKGGPKEAMIIRQYVWHRRITNEPGQNDMMCGRNADYPLAISRGPWRLVGSI